MVRLGRKILAVVPHCRGLAWPIPLLAILYQDSRLSLLEDCFLPGLFILTLRERSAFDISGGPRGGLIGNLLSPLPFVKRSSALLRVVRFLRRGETHTAVVASVLARGPHAFFVVNTGVCCCLFVSACEFSVRCCSVGSKFLALLPSL